MHARLSCLPLGRAALCEYAAGGEICPHPYNGAVGKLVKPPPFQGGNYGFEPRRRYNDSGAQHLENAAGVNSHGLMNKIAAILVRLVFP